jgi:succinyl-CoA synthetase alpha subunit
MGVIINKQPEVIVQGITGNQGRFHTESMLRYGTNIVAGVTPGKQGQQVQGVPVYDTVSAAVRNHDADTSIIFVPARSVRDAVFEAIDAGIKTLVVISESIPQRDAIEFIARADSSGVTIVGPNTPGVIKPGNRVHIGIMPGHVFKPGRTGMISRSGTLTYEVAWHISNAGMGQSTCVGIGGDAIVGLDFIKVLELFRNDKETESVVLIGEIGGNAEELAAEYIRQTGYEKPVVAYIAGRLAPPEKRMGHAGAIIMGNVGTAKSKIDAFTAAGVPVAEKPGDVVNLLKTKL